MVAIALCAPSTPITRKDAERVSAIAAGYPDLTLRFHEQCFASEGHFAGSDETRLAALLECANDPAIDVVWFAKGGYGANRIAGAAVAAMGPAAHAKRFLGYSDAGYLLAGLYREGIGIPVHAPMATDIRRDGGCCAIRRVLDYLSGAADGLEPSRDERPAVAFNLMTLASLCGTTLMPDLSGHVVMVEEVAEHLYAIDRLFFHVAAHLEDIAGLRLGRVSAVPENDRPFGATAEGIARFWCDRHRIPFVGQADIGHDADNKIVPFGLAAAAALP